MRTSRTSNDLLLRLRNDERAHQAEVERLSAVARAVVFDHELYMLGGAMHEIFLGLDPQVVQDQETAAVRWVERSVPTNPLPLLNRFAGDLGAFGAKDSSKLLAVIGGWNTVSGSPRSSDVPGKSLQEMREELLSYRGAVKRFLMELAAAREITQAWSREVVDDSPETDWIESLIEMSDNSGD